MKIVKFLSRLRERNIELWLDGDRLRCKATANALTPELRSKLAERKEEIIEFLQKAAVVVPKAEQQPPQPDQPPVEPVAEPKPEATPPTEQTFRIEPCSPAQCHTWILQQLRPNQAVSQHFAAFALDGPLSVASFYNALERGVARHQALRTSFATHAGKLMQTIHAHVPIDFKLVDMRELPSPQELLRSMAKVKGHAPPDSERAPLLQTLLFRLDTQRHIVFFLVHGLVADGASFTQLLEELSSEYRQFLDGRTPTTSDVTSFIDHITEQNHWLQQEASLVALNWWKELLHDIRGVLEIPGDRPRAKVQSFRAAQLKVAMPEAIRTQIRAFGERYGTSDFIVLMAAFKLLLHRFSNHADLIVGTELTTRPRKAFETAIGNFQNRHALRIKIKNDQTFRDLVSQLSAQHKQATSHVLLPHEILLDELRLERDLSRHPLFQVAIYPSGPAAPELRFPLIETRPFETDTVVSDLDLSYAVIDPTSLTCEITYAAEIFNESTIARIHEHLITLLETALAREDTPLSELSPLSEQQRHTMLKQWNQTLKEFDKPHVLSKLITERASANPDSEALRLDGQSISFATVDKRSNQLAHFLRRQGIGPDKTVAIFMERCLERAIALLGVLKTGAAYVPLDPDYPLERLSYILDDSGSKLLLCQRDLNDLISAPDTKVVNLEPHWELFEHYSEEPPEPNTNPDHLAYVIYTSGPTGRPKGVQTTHQGVCNRLLWLQDSYHLGAGDRLLQKTPFAFDISVWEIFWPLISGACLVLARPGTHRDSRLLIDQVSANKITHLHFVPSMLSDFLTVPEADICLNLKHVFCSGEALPLDLQKRFFNRFPKARLHNLYGPPEVTIDATYWDFSSASSRYTFPIGKPIANVQVYLIDAHFRTVPIGVEGELMIGGNGLARGYHKYPSLTAQKFIPDPFGDQPGTRLFRTGDLARFLPDGNLEFVGHLEHQKKVRGFRINFGEIKAIMEGHVNIAEALVLTRRGTSGQSCLVAYYKTVDKRRLSSEELRNNLKKILPHYMIPKVFEYVTSFPMTPDGKIERRALPVPDTDIGAEAEPYARAHSEIERIILQAWREILGVTRIGVEDDFFDIGGSSIDLVMVYRMLPDLIKKDLELIDLFKHPSIHELAMFFEAREEELALSSRGQDHYERVKRKMHEVKESDRMHVAVVGMAGRFPGADTPTELWQLIIDGINPVSTFTKQELEEAGVDPEQLDDPNYVPIRGMISDVKGFDADFFGFTPREAQVTDPQHRLFLECAWEALENAGCIPQKYQGSIGIFGGAGYSEYFAGHIAPNRDLWERVGAMPILIGNANDNLCTRVAFKLGLTGPAITVQTACSTGLVAVHLACQALMSRDCKVALAGGVSLGEMGKCGYVYEEGLNAPPDGKCRSFDKDASGGIQSQGAAIVVLKRLEDAIQDGDRIYSVIRGTAVNNDGSLKTNYTGYSLEGQRDVILRALQGSDINPETITYIETSSTASKLGDPIEVACMTQAYRHFTEKRGYCALGALKPNIGALDTAAGTASLIKASLALFHQKMPPIMYFREPNPEIDFEASPFYVNTRMRDWETGGLTRRAGVNAFGLGGTNAHIVMEEAPQFEPSPQSRTWQIVTLSAKTSAALETMSEDFVCYMAEHPHENFADMCFTQHVGRRDFKYRRVMVAQHLHDAVFELRKTDSDRVYTAMHKADERPIAFMFPGQGAQYLNMGRQLYREEKIYRREVDRCWAIVHKHFPDLYKGLSDKDLGGRTHQVDRTLITQPLLFATEYALARLLMHWGIEPKAMIGNSLGEYVAACLAGVMSLEDCIVAIVTRGRLMQEMPPGAQLAVKLPENRVLGLLNDELSLAGVPTPDMCMISGTKQAISDLKHKLDAKNITCYRLHASHAFHSFMMDPVVEAFTEKMSELALKPPLIPFISNVTGTWITDEQATDPHYWARHLREPVLFSKGLSVLYEEPNRVLLEVGPEKILSGAAIAHPDKTREHRVLATMRQPQEEESDLHHLLNTIGRLWLFGVEIDWDNYHGDKKRFRMPLPTYPFDKVEHWIERTNHMLVLEPDVLQKDIEPDMAHYRPNVSTEFVAPRDEEEKFIAELWCEFLGLEEVGIHDDFFELGGSSLIAVRLISQLGQHFNVPLASHILLKKRTIATLKHYIGENATSLEETNSPLVEIQRGHPRVIPLFLVHPIGGEVFFYREMAQSLGAEQPVYGFQAPSLVGKMEPFSDIVKQASYYVRELLQFRPKGPYILGGSSYGGVVAFEMAQQLKERGNQVSLVVLVDSPAPGAMPGKTSDFAEIIEYLLGDDLKIKAADLRELEPEEMLAYVFEEARYANRMDLLPPTLGIPMFKTWMAHQDAMHGYRPQPYEGRLIFFRPSEPMPPNPANMHLPWIDIVQGGMELHRIPGNHLTMNLQPNVRQLARYLKRALRNLK